MLDGEVMDVPCETCGQDVKVKLGALRKSPTVTCACGQEIEVDATQLDSSLGEVDAAIAGLDGTIKQMNKTLGG
jgi:hypothetical protein